MTTLTVDLADELSAFVCADAEQMGMTVSEYFSGLVGACMAEAREYEAARRSFLAIKPVYFEWIGGHRPTREELHDRPCLR